MQQSADKPKKIAIQHDGMLTIATATSRRSTAWKNTDMSYSDFLKKLSTTVRTKESLGEYMKLSKDEQGSIKDVGGFVGGSLKGGRRKADSVAWRQLITLDADFIQGDFWDGVTAFFDNACAIYSTHKHTPNKPRIRLIIPLSRPVSAEEYVAVAKKLADIFGIDYFDDTTYQPHRLMYWPSTANDGEYVFDYQDAKWLDPAEILKMYNDWRDPAEWPESSRQRESRKKMADKQGDPLTKPGMVGAFCRTYTITEAIETFLSDVYSDAGDGRYTFNGGSTTGGLVLYDDVFAYSHHGTDPVSEQLVNAYDLVRLHLFNDLDEDAKEGTPVNRLPSAKAMNDKVRSLDKVKDSLINERIKSATEDFYYEMDNSEQVIEIERIKELCKELELNNKGELEPSLTNAAILIEAYIKVALDTFGNVVRLTGDLPWRKKAKGYEQYEMWRDSDFARLAYWLNKTHGVLFPERILQTAFVEVTERHKFNPVQLFIEGGANAYDGIERAETVFIDYLGAEDTPYTREVTKRWLVGLVRRAWEPIKFDNLIVLVGPQGCGKSTIAKKLACFGQYFNDSLQSFKGKDAMEAVRSAFILEIAELSALGNNTLEEVKAFISKQHDSFRASYARTLEHYPRHCAFIGTTNSSNFLKDVTGSRRFWVIDTMVNKPSKSVHDDLSELTIKLILGEVYVKWRNEVPKLSAELEAIAMGYQEEHSEIDPRLTPIMKFLETPVPETWNDEAIWDIEKRRHWIKSIPIAPENFDEMDASARMKWLDSVKSRSVFNFEDNKNYIHSLDLQDRVTLDEVLSEALGKDLALCKAYEKRDVGELLRHKLKWQQKGLLKQVKAYSSKRQKAFSRPDDTC